MISEDKQDEYLKARLWIESKKQWAFLEIMKSSTRKPLEARAKDVLEDQTV